jgi:hypothetical protein
MRPLILIPCAILISAPAGMCESPEQQTAEGASFARLAREQPHYAKRDHKTRETLKILDDGAGFFSKQQWREAVPLLESAYSNLSASKPTIAPYRSFAREALAECSHQLALETWEQRWLLRDRNEPLAWVVKTRMYDPTHAGARALYPQALAWSQLANKDRDFAAWRARAWCSWLTPAADAFDPAVIAERDQLLWEQHGVPWRVDWLRHMRTARPSAPR